MIKKIDTLIINGLLYDGSGSEPRIANISISGDVISGVGVDRDEKAETVIDATGLSVAPGFIDTHSHSDFTILADARAEGKICQGITTEINGNCGISAAPLYGMALERRNEDLRELGIMQRWNSLEEYFSILKKMGSAVNIIMFAGHGNIRGAVAGYHDRAVSVDELKIMSGMFHESITEGAIGLSTGLIYPPGIYSDTRELIELVRRNMSESLIYASHMRSEGDELLEAVQEILRIGTETGVRIHISHIKTAGKRNWHKVEEVITLLNEAIANGIKVTCDRYPYIASSTELDAILPSWVYEGGVDEEIERLKNIKTREKINSVLEEDVSGDDYWENIIVSSVASSCNKWMEGNTVKEISNRLKMDEIDAVLKIIIEERTRAGAIFRTMSEENLRKFLSLPFCMIGTDSSARSFDGLTKTGKPHPRGFGTFPRFIGKYARDEKLFSLSEAIRKSTALPAETFGIQGRGMIKEGMLADIVIFDQGKIIDKATFSNPFQKPDGIFYLFTNGEPTVFEGMPTGRLPGRIL